MITRKPLSASSSGRSSAINKPVSPTDPIDPNDPIQPTTTGSRNSVSTVRTRGASPSHSLSRLSQEEISFRLNSNTFEEANAVIKLALMHVGEPYVLGARAPMANANWRGPWDCAEFASWCLYQSTGILFGVEPRHDAMRADAFTGYWEQQAHEANAIIPVEKAVAIEGAFLLRVPHSGRVGHIALSDGTGGTVEAHSSLRGVIADTASGRRWDCGVLVPRLRYFASAEAVFIDPPTHLLRLTNPMQRGEAVSELQRNLERLKYFPGAIDGIYGPQTEAAVAAFQADNGLLVDGEFGNETRKLLIIKSR